MGSGWGVGEWLMALLFVVILAGIASIIVWTVRTGPIRPPATGSEADAEEVLAVRLAHGEISPEEYRERLEALRGAGPPAE